jgi:hypothetical protein
MALKGIEAIVSVYFILLKKHKFKKIARSVGADGGSV